MAATMEREVGKASSWYGCARDGRGEREEEWGFILYKYYCRFIN